ncbi:hypothetical protein D3C76_1790670 [compost metagenome]
MMFAFQADVRPAGGQQGLRRQQLVQGAGGMPVKSAYACVDVSLLLRSVAPFRRQQLRHVAADHGGLPA